jgi:HAD superfamily hydrolase (TIGR01549 family)
MLKIKAISFDFWQTLFTETQGAFKNYQARRCRLLKDALARQGTYCSEEQIELATHAEAESHHLIWTEEHRTLSAGERVERILTLLKARLTADEMRRVVSDYEEGILEEPPVLIDGVREVIEAVSRQGFRLGIISDVGYSPGRVLKRVLRDAGIYEAFTSLVFSDEAGQSKPHRKVFQQTSQALGAAPDEILHIGDLEHTDIVGAKGAGFYAIRFIGITPMADEEKTRADRVTAKFADIPRLIEELGGQG